MGDRFDFLSEIALCMVVNTDFTRQMPAIFDLTGSYSGLSRISLSLDSACQFVEPEAYSWPNNAGRKSVPDRILEDTFWKDFLSHSEYFSSNQYVSLPDIVSLSLKEEGETALLVFPLHSESKLIGYVEYVSDTPSRTWTEEEIFLLRIVTSLISGSCERKYLQDRHLRTEENFNTFFNTVEDFMFILAPDGKILHGNKAMYNRLGYSRSLLAKMTFTMLQPEHVAQLVSVFLGGENSEAFPVFVKGKNGAVMTTQARCWNGQWDGKDALFVIAKETGREQEALEKFRKLFEGNPALMAISSFPDNHFLDVNEAFIERLGYSRSDVINYTVHEFGLIADEGKYRDFIDALMENGSVRNMELPVRRKDGSILYGLLSAEFIENQLNRYLLTVMVDISEQKMLQQSIERERQRLDNIINGTRLGTWEWNVQTGETVFNERWAEIIGYTLENLMPVSIQTWLDAAHPEDLVVSGELLNAHFEGKSPFYEFECRMKHRDGHWVWVHDRGKVIEWDAGGKPLRMFGTHADISEKRILEDKVRELSIRDPLTNVYNRRYLFDRLEVLLAEFLRERRDFSVTMLDIDHFKQFNDTYGHLAGDFILKEFTGILGRNLRSYDLLGRYGGEEFVIVTMNSLRENTSRVIGNILDIVRASHFDFGGEALSFTFSGGIADTSEFAPGLVSIEKLIEKADERLYTAKLSGRNRIVCKECNSRS